MTAYNYMNLETQNTQIRTTLNFIKHKIVDSGTEINKVVYKDHRIND
jgi:hypothetical protein